MYSSNPMNPSRRRRPTHESLEGRRLLTADLFPPLVGPLSATQAPIFGNDLLAQVEVEWQGHTARAIGQQWLVRLDGIHGRPANQLAEANLRLVDLATMTGDLAVTSLRFTRHLGLDGLFLLKSGKPMVAAETTAILSQLPGFRYLEPDFVAETTALRPNDPRFGQQWSLENKGRVEADIDAPEAWELTTGSSDVVVAVMDSGIDYTHPDLAQNIWVNPGEVPGDQIDNDGNGYVDDVHGYDFFNQDGDPMDAVNHGTLVAGVIGAQSNNGVGVAGLNWNVRLMAVGLLEVSPASLSVAAEGINYVAMMRRDFGVNVRVANASFGHFPSQAIYESIVALNEAGILLVAAAGNGGVDRIGDNNDLVSPPLYPASYDLPHIISVGATTAEDRAEPYSNYGAVSVDLHAPTLVPTTNIRTGWYYPDPTNGYADLSGTSGATPHVSGVAALAWSLAPTATVADIKAAILDGVDPIASLAGKSVTGGRLNAYNTLQKLGLHVAQTTPADGEILQLPATGLATLRQFTVSFSHPIQVREGVAATLTVNGRPADAAERINDRSLRFEFLTSPITEQGPQTLRLGIGGITRSSDGAPLTREFDMSFFVDSLATGPASVVPAPGTAIAAGATTLEVTFDEDLAAEPLVTPGQLVTSQGTVLAARRIAANRVAFDLQGLDVEGPWHATVRGLRDRWNNPITARAFTWYVDRDETALPALEPVGSTAGLARAATVQGFFSRPGDQDAYTVELAAGQILTALARSRAGEPIQLTVLDPQGTVLGNLDTSGTADRMVPALLSAMPVIVGGRYRLVVRGTHTQPGELPYELQLHLNSLLDADVDHRRSNDEAASAQSLDAGFVALGGGGITAVTGRHDWPSGRLDREREPNTPLIGPTEDASRDLTRVSSRTFQLALDGQLETSADADWFNLGKLTEGDWLTLTLGDARDRRGTLPTEMLRLVRLNQGNPLEVVAPHDPGTNSQLSRWLVPATDTYYAVVAAAEVANPTGTYQLAASLEARPGNPVPKVTESVTAESVDNDTLTTATPSGNSWRQTTFRSEVNGSVGPGDVDWYRYQFQANDVITILVDSLDTAWTNFSLQGPALVGNPPDRLGRATVPGTGRGSVLTSYRITEAGTYDLIVGATSGAGDYRLQVDSVLGSSELAQPATADWYSVAARRGDVLAIGVLGSVLDFATLTVWAGDGAELASGVLYGNFLRAVPGLVVPADGVYRLKVSGTPGAEYQLLVGKNLALDLEQNNLATQAQPLTTGTVLARVGSGIRLTREVEPNSIGGLFEPSDSHLLANNLAGSLRPASRGIGERLYSADLSGGFSRTDLRGYVDADWFRVPASVGDTLTVRIAAANDVDVELGVHDDMQRVLGFSDLAGADESITLTRQLTYDGDYYIRACSYFCRYPGQYTLTVELRSLNPRGIFDEDYFRVSLAEGKSYRFTAASARSGLVEDLGQLSLGLELRDAAGQLVSASDAMERVDGVASLGYLAAASGEYTLRVLARAGEGSYVLSVVDESTAGRVGDLDRSGVVDAFDLNALSAQIALRGFDPRFDLAPDGIVDQRDVDYLIEEVLQTTRGDLDLDGDVDAADLAALLAGWTGADDPRIEGPQWQKGDFDGEGATDSDDLLELLANWTGGELGGLTDEG